MTAILHTPADEAFDWRAQSVCAPEGADRAFDSVDDLVEDRGVEKTRAAALVDAAIADAKAVCLSCPVRARCRDSAMTNDEKFGVWGGMSVAEREAYRPTWLKIKRLQGLTITPVQKDQDALRDNSGVDAKLRVRQQRAQAAKDALMLKGPSYELDLRGKRYPKFSYDQLMQFLDMALANPHQTAGELAARIGRKRAWFADVLRFTFEAMGV
jgi:hypothetical protein